LRELLRREGPFSDHFKNLGFCLDTANGLSYLHAEKLIKKLIEKLAFVQTSNNVKKQTLVKSKSEEDNNPIICLVKRIIKY